MTRPTNWIQQLAIRVAVKLAPQDRVGWISAMAAELEHIPPAARIRFVAGCLLAALKMRARSRGFPRLAARCLLVTGAGGWAVLNLRFAGLPDISDTPAIQAFAYTAAAVFVTGGLATAHRGIDATIALAAPLLLLGGAAAIIARMTLPPNPENHLLLALLVEHLAILMVALAAAFTARNFNPAGGEAAR